jgi:hypothetical protein
MIVVLSKYKSNLTGWIKFLVGLILLTLVILFFASGITPPGVCGEVLRHNQQNNIDASPIWYMGVEKMQQYEKAVQK